MWNLYRNGLDTQQQPQAAAQVNTIEIHLRDFVLECTEEETKRVLEATNN
jgi:hypothetical protein